MGEKEGIRQEHTPRKKRTKQNSLILLGLAVIINVHILLLDTNLIKKVDLSFHCFSATECITMFY